MIKEILNEINAIERFLKNHREYLGEEYAKYQTTLNELRLKVKLKEIENNVMDALTLKSDEEYLKARDLLKKSSNDIDKLEDEMINLKIKTFNSQITNLKNQINNELNFIKNLLLGEDSSINAPYNSSSVNSSNPINQSFSGENELLNILNELLSKYQNPIKIGEGGFSHVFKVIKNGKTVALKVPKELTEITGELFLREIGNWKKLKHINIVRLYYSNIYPYPYVEMEYCEKELNKIKNNLELKEAVLLFFEVLNGLKYAHSKGIIHKDLKPHNILINNNIPKITDWGLSKETTSKSTTINALTLQYSAPEQISRGTIDKRTDIYQMGVILYELTTKNYRLMVMSLT
ncbi:serine/threonine-protein kinase [Methanothermococcus thermolithotrophicus]|uniref:serine/threonine-protein kinase n=1 Tax=Methanothermococcus thermolithotrophicus TaxID=2186 RepID=UPI000AE81E3C|nr:serine/threonine-protein kinase [Methanothermococcus thermolithotrophicus]